MSPARQSSSRLFPAALAALVMMIGIVHVVEWPRFLAAKDQAGALSWLFNWNTDTTPFALLLVGLPVAFVWRNGLRRTASFLLAEDGWLERLHPVAGAIVVGVAAWVGYATVADWPMSDSPKAVKFGDLPPAYHDEYSYLFQAETFLSGAVKVEPPEHAELFNQMHVLNEGTMASRYFPAVGAWFVPFLAAGKVYWAQWTAGTLAAIFVFFAGREIGGNVCGLVAGLLLAASPGVRLFGNLLLAHHPTLLGLSGFLFAYLRFSKTRSAAWGVVAGIGLTFAMLSRPMSAAGFALPMGIHLFVTSLVFRRADESGWWSRLKPLVAVGSPVVAGFFILFAYNHAVTGRALTPPYQLYTDIYTPRHVYGFNNVERGERRLGPKVIDHYDEWAENLDGELAWDNVVKRVIASFQWTHGLIPVACSCVLMFVLFPTACTPNRLVVLSLISMHAAHVPYWFVGIMNWHYVFESAPLLVLLVAAGLVESSRRAIQSNRHALAVWCLLFVLIPMWPNGFAADGFWPVSRIEAGISEVAFSRRKYADFEYALDSLGQPCSAAGPCAAGSGGSSYRFCDESPAAGGSAIGWPSAEGESAEEKLADVLETYQNWTVCIFDAKTGQVELID